jgi:hypothetical protein
MDIKTKIGLLIKMEYSSMGRNSCRLWKKVICLILLLDLILDGEPNKN